MADGQPPFQKDHKGKPVLDEMGMPRRVLDKDGNPVGHLAILESLGGGIGLIDFDGDGLLDIFVPGGGYYEKTAKDLDQMPKDVAVYAISGWMDGAGYANGALSRFLSLPNAHRRLMLGPWDHGARVNASPGYCMK